MFDVANELFAIVLFQYSHAHSKTCLVTHFI